MSEVDRLFAMRKHFVRFGDIGLVGEIDAKLARLGIAPRAEFDEDEPPQLERAVPKAAAKRGRPKKVTDAS